MKRADTIRDEAQPNGKPGRRNQGTALYLADSRGVSAVIAYEVKRRNGWERRMEWINASTVKDLAAKMRRANWRVPRDLRRRCLERLSPRRKREMAWR